MDLPTHNPESWITELANLAESDARRALLERHDGARSPQVSQQLYDEALRLMRIDVDRADRVSEALLWATDHLRADRTRGQALRMNAHILYLRGQNESAVTAYSAAQAVFDELGDEVEAARTISAAIHPLIYLGRSDQALILAERARSAFIKHDDQLRLARLDVNVGNLYYRQDRFGDALAMYERARSVLEALGDAQDVAIVLRNMAVSELGLGRFDRALAFYREARDFTAKHDLPLLLAEADYNVAYLYFLRGEYTQAVQLYEAARTRCGSVGDVYHRSLCDLDQSEIYLEVNMVEEADVLAADAFEGFEQLGMRYESAKALTFRALAASRMHKRELASKWLATARSMFVSDKNRLWPALIDFYKAVILFEQGSCSEARTLCDRALQRFRHEGMKSRAALCQLLFAKLDQSEGRFAQAKSSCMQALDILKQTEAPSVNFQAQLLLGQVLEASGDKEQAFAAYTTAHLQLEALRNHVQVDEIKISFLKDKLSVYEGLVALCIQSGDDAKAFDFIERAKSRSLADTIASRFSGPRLDSAGRTVAAVEVDSISDLSTQRRYLLRRDEKRTTRDLGTSWETPNLSMDAVRASREKADDSSSSQFFAPANVSLAAIQQALGTDTVILEYYETRGTIYACVITKDQFKVLPVAKAEEIRLEFQLLQFQLAKFRFGPAYVKTFAAQLQRTIDAHLRALYVLLIAPVRDELRGKHLVIVPHEVLHRVPFHALTDGERYLIDDYRVSYAPSAGIHHLCALSGVAETQDSLVLGVPDSLAPDIFAEAQAVASILPNAKVHIGESATAERLMEKASASRVIHIASHGHAYDNPMFSSIKLADGDIGLLDLYQLHLDAELVTLSGCGTGLNVVVGGDELIGLVRGLLHSGARSVLATLWDVNDTSTATFMTSFYWHWAATSNRALAVQKAMQELRETHPHPYYWAPFTLIGKNV